MPKIENTSANVQEMLKNGGTVDQITEKIANILNGNLIVKKAEQDGNGSNIVDTYTTKDEFNDRGIQIVNLDSNGSTFIEAYEALNDIVVSGIYKINITGSDNLIGWLIVAPHNNALFQILIDYMSTIRYRTKDAPTLNWNNWESFATYQQLQDKESDIMYQVTNNLTAIVETITLTTTNIGSLTVSSELNNLRDNKIYKIKCGSKYGWLFVTQRELEMKNTIQTIIDFDGSIYHRYHSGGSSEEGWSDWSKYISTENIDTALSDTSTNPVQNKVIKQAIDLKAEQLELERLKYYGDKDIIPSDESYFTVNETGETITGLTDAGKTQTELVIPYRINNKEITTLSSNSSHISILDGATDKITKVVLPNSVTTIGKFAFDCCSSLTSINIPNSVTSIENGAFGDCTSLTSINIPNTVTSIGNQAFGGCTSLTSINIPDSVTSIGIAAFSHCASLTSITISNSVTNIGSSAFRDCTNLTIYCEQGSYAETYAKSNNIPVKYTDIDASKYITKDTVESTYATKTSVIPKISLWQPNTPYEVGNVVLAIDPDGWYYTAVCISEHISSNIDSLFSGDTSYWNITELKTPSSLNAKFSLEAKKASADANGNYIDLTYATKTELRPTPITSTATAITANNSYNYGEQTELSITFPTTANDGDVVYITFTSGATATVLTLDTTNTSDIELIPEANTGYEVYAKYNGTIWIVNYSDYTVTAEAGA